MVRMVVRQHRKPSLVRDWEYRLPGAAYADGPVVPMGRYRRPIQTKGSKDAKWPLAISWSTIRGADDAHEVNVKPGDQAVLPCADPCDRGADSHTRRHWRSPTGTDRGLVAGLSPQPPRSSPQPPGGSHNVRDVVASQLVVWRCQEKS